MCFYIEKLLIILTAYVVLGRLAVEPVDGAVLAALALFAWLTILLVVTIGDEGVGDVTEPLVEAVIWKTRKIIE